MNDDLKVQLDHFLALMDKHDLLELEVTGEGFKVRLKKKYEGVRKEFVAVPALNGGLVSSAGGAATSEFERPAEPAPGLTPIKSPMVGTFYRAPSPESASYVEVGAELEPDTVVCCIEAMKVFNEIKAELEGIVVDVLAENGQVVEYGQPLFLIKVAAE